MKQWLVGAGMVIGGSMVWVLLMVLGVPRPVAVGIGMACGIAGFIIQMFAAFSMKAAADKDLHRMQVEHEELLRRARELPPEEAVALLLKSIK